MDTMLKRLLSLAVALVMVIGLMPWSAASVYATGEEVSEETEPSTETEPVEEEAVHTHSDCECCTVEGVEWTPWSGNATELANGGHFYLAEDNKNMTGNAKLSNVNVTICLNGNTLNIKYARGFLLSDEASLTIVDCTASGTGEDYTAGTIKTVRETGTRGEFVYGEDSTLTMWDGIIDGNGVKSSGGSSTDPEYGGLIQAFGDQVVNIHGGWLKDYDAYRGGAIYVTDTAIVNMHGGYISGCSATRGNAVCVDSIEAGDKPVFNMYGGTISGNGTTASNRGIDTVVARGSSGKATVNMYGGTISDNITGTANSGLAATNIGEVNVSGGTISGNTKGIVLSGKASATVSSGTISENDRGIHATENGKVTISGGTITGSTSYAVYLIGEATAEMTGGSITGNSKNTSVYLGDTAEFTMKDGTISENMHYGVMLAAGTPVFNMEGGTISGNQHSGQGAGLRVNAGTVNMTGGTITGNYHTGTAGKGNAAGVYVAANGTFNMSGGEISGNTFKTAGASAQVNVAGTANLSGTAAITMTEADTYAIYGEGITISGGTYTSDVTAYLAEGYVQNSLTGEVVQSCTEHTPAEEGTVTKEPTCTEEGVKTYYCTVCGVVISTDIIPTGAHSYESEQTKAPTCGEVGEMTYTCSVCSKTYTEEIDDLGGHKYENGKCTVCDAEDPNACDHQYTYDCDKVCQICHTESRPEADHNVVHKEANAATCYENGNLEYWYCEKCSAAWLDEACTLNTNLKAVVLPMGHGEIIHAEAKASTCYEEGNIEYWYCADCGRAWLDADCTQNTNLSAVKLPTLEPVASIGDVNYGSLKAAIDAANISEGADTIKILADITESENLAVTSEIVITADKAVTVTTTHSGHMISTTSGKLTIAGASEESPITLKAGDATDWIVYNKNATTELNHVVIDGSSESYGIYAEGGETTAKSVSIQKGGVGIYVWKGTVNLDDVTISGVSSYGIKTHGTVNITNTIDSNHALTVENSNDHAIDIASHTGSSGKVISNLTGDIEGKYPIVIDTTRRSSGRGILVRAGGELNITNVSIQKVKYYGLDLLAATSVASISNAIIDSEGYGIATAAGSELTVSNVTVQKCGDTATNILGTRDGEITLTHSYENGVCSVCGHIKAEISLSGSLNLLDKVIPIYTVNVNEIADGITVAECGVLLYDDADKAATKDPKQAFDTIVLGESYTGQSAYGIDARDMDKTQYAVAYVKLSDDTYVYVTEEFSPLIYCQKAIATEGMSEDVKNVCRAMMHYGAAAQKVQYGKTDGLMNADFGEFVYDESVLGTTVFSANTRTVNGMKLRSVTMALKGAISYIVKFSVDDSLADKELYAEYTLLSDEAKTVKLEKGTDGKLWATISGIPPKDLGATLTVKPYYVGENNEKVYGGELVFSGYEYTRIVTKNTNYDEKIKELAKALAMYVYYANVYGNQ